jgi:hypothetical protein
MTRVVLDDENVVAALDAIPQRSELCDTRGRVLGYFVPHAADVVFYRGVKSPLSPEERQRLLNEGAATARPLSDFWDDMKRKYPNEFE